MKKTYLLLAIVILAIAVVYASSLTFMGNTVNKPIVVGNDQKDSDGNYFKGSVDAPVTIIEYSDFECPFCGRFFKQTLPSIRQNYIDTGKVKLIFKHFPLSFHQDAIPAAEAAECAGEQGSFWAMHDKIFENQKSLSDALYKQLASDIGIDLNQFEECTTSHKYLSKIQSDLNDGRIAGVTGTPAFFINGKKIIGAQPYSTFSDAIENLI